MKKLLFSILFSISIIAGIKGQTINNVPIKDIDVEYITIVGLDKDFSNKVKVHLDFGQKNSVWSDKKMKIKDENGKDVSFESMIDALNFMSLNGYDFVQAYVIPGGSNGGGQTKYIMRKRK